jgi:hypothetical protein
MVSSLEEYLAILIPVDTAERYHCAANIITLPHLRAVNCLPYRYKDMLDRMCWHRARQTHDMACSSGEPCCRLVARFTIPNACERQFTTHKGESYTLKWSTDSVRTAGDDWRNHGRSTNMRFSKNGTLVSFRSLRASLRQCNPAETPWPVYRIPVLTT